jgi:hypothetical protein
MTESSLFCLPPWSQLQSEEEEEEETLVSTQYLILFRLFRWWLLIGGAGAKILALFACLVFP